MCHLLIDVGLIPNRLDRSACVICAESNNALNFESSILQYLIKLYIMFNYIDVNWSLSNGSFERGGDNKRGA